MCVLSQLFWFGGVSLSHWSVFPVIHVSILVDLLNFAIKKMIKLFDFDPLTIGNLPSPSLLKYVSSSPFFSYRFFTIFYTTHHRLCTNSSYTPFIFC